MRKFKLCLLAILISSLSGPPSSFSADQFYTVRKGDTLWDLSRRFFQDNALWPNLWKNNPSIMNPHFIYPGSRLYVLPNPESSAPKGPEVSEVQKDSTGPELPAQPSAGNQCFFSYLKMKTVGFISSHRIQAKGVIDAEIDGKELISSHDLVYVRSTQYNLLKPGTNWMVFKQVRDPAKQVETRARFGFHYLPAGEVEIVKNGYPAVGRIISAYLPISSGDELHPVPDSATDIPLRFRSDGLEAAIIKAEPPVDQIGQFNIVYIDKGRKDGVEVGNSFEVLKTIQVAGIQERVPVAELIVLRVSEDFSSALVTRSKRSFSVGETVRAKAGHA